MKWSVVYYVNLCVVVSLFSKVNLVYFDFCCFECGNGVKYKDFVGGI